MNAKSPKTEPGDNLYYRISYRWLRLFKTFWEKKNVQYL